MSGVEQEEEGNGERRKHAVEKERSAAAGPAAASGTRREDADKRTTAAVILARLLIPDRRGARPRAAVRRGIDPPAPRHVPRIRAAAAAPPAAAAMPRRPQTDLMKTVVEAPFPRRATRSLKQSRLGSRRPRGTALAPSLHGTGASPPAAGAAFLAARGTWTPCRRRARRRVSASA